MSSDPGVNERAVTALFDLMVNQCRPREAVERYAEDVYVLHNAQVADGKRGVRRVLRQLIPETSASPNAML